MTTFVENVSLMVVPLKTGNPETDITVVWHEVPGARATWPAPKYPKPPTSLHTLTMNIALTFH